MVTALIAATAWVAVLLLFSWRFLISVWRSHAARRWPCATGTITGSEILRNSFWATVRRYRVVVRYDYEVSGRRYSGSTLTLYRRWTRNRLAVLENEYFSKRVGTQMDVYHHPRDPKCSLLVPGVDARAIVKVGMWLLGFVLPIYLILKLGSP